MAEVHLTDEQPPSDEWVWVLQTLAGQLAIGIQNARLFAQTQQSLGELSRLYQMMTVEAWEDFLEAEPSLRFRRLSEGAAFDEEWKPLLEQARRRGRPATARFGEEENGIYALAVPVKLRGVPIGVVGFHRPAQAGAWRPDEIAVAEAVAERMALAMENVRLLEEARRRAARERAVSEVSARLSRHLDVEGVLQAAARELGRLPQVVEAAVQLIPPEAGPEGA